MSRLLPRFDDMPIRSKILCCLAIALLPVALVMGTAIWTVNTSRIVHLDVNDHIVPELLAFTDLREKGLRLIDRLDRLAGFAQVLHDNPEKLANTVGRERSALDIAVNAFAASYEAVAALKLPTDDPDVSENRTQTTATVRELAAMPALVVSALSNAPTIDEIIRLRRQFKDQAYRFHTLINGAVTYENRELTEGSESLTHAIGATLAIMAGGLMLILAANWLSATYVSRRIVRPLLGLCEAAPRIGKGDFDVALRKTADDEVGDLIEAFAEMTQRLKKNVQELIFAKEAAQAADRVKSNFLANMSHELRTPLNAILGFAEIMATQMLGPMTPESYLGYAREIHGSGEHLLGIVNSVLDLSKIEAGSFILNEEPCDVEEIIGAAVRMIEVRATEGDLTVAQEIAEASPRILADMSALKQILLNLLGNAVKFTPDGGRILVAAGVSDTGGLSIRVSDNGIGIAPEHHGRIFTRFAQVDDSYARQHGGTGLGLHITRKLVELHQGTIQLDSELGAGTTVTITLPPERVLPRDAGSAQQRAVGV